jgi:8-oxo-dGTP diphosphatase
VVRNGQFLMGRRRNAHGDGSWSVPGGHLEFGESWEQTAKREVLEETGLEIANVRFGAVTNDHFADENKHYVTIWMMSDHLRGEPAIAEPDKYIEIGWYDFNALPSPLFLPWSQLLKSSFINNIKRQLLV